MSLIQEALRRQQEELETGTKDPNRPEETFPVQDSEPDAAPPAEDTPVMSAEEPSSLNPEPIPVRSSSDVAPSDEAPIDEPTESYTRRAAPERKHRVLGPLLGMLIIIILLGGFATWAALWGWRTFTASEPQPALVTADVTPTQPPPPPQDIEPEERDEQADPAPDAVATDAPEPVAETAKAEDPSVQEVTETADAEDPSVQEADVPATEIEGRVAEVAEQETPAPVVATEPSPAAPPAPAPPAAPIIWPELHVAGIMGAGDSGSAIINGRVVGLDERVGEVTVREFGRGFVVLEYQGETRRFSVGRSTR